MAISARLIECVRQVTSVDDMIFHVRLEYTCVLLTVVVVNAPPEDHELRYKEQLYHKVDSMVERCPAGDVLVVLNDFNAETGRYIPG